MSTVAYMEADEVVERIRQSGRNGMGLLLMKTLLSFFPRNCEYTDDSFVIVDVRDEDEVRFDGQIKGPVLHIPSGQFSTLANAKDILRENKLLGKRTIAVHCHKSQQRGPYCARILSTAISELSPESENYTEM